MAPGEDRSHADGATDVLRNTHRIPQPSVAYYTYVSGGLGLRKSRGKDGYEILLKKHDHDVICAVCETAIIGQCFDIECDRSGSHAALDLPCDDCDPNFWDWDGAEDGEPMLGAPQAPAGER